MIFEDKIEMNERCCFFAQNDSNGITSFAQMTAMESQVYQIHKMLNAFCDKCGDTFTSVERKKLWDKRGNFLISHKNAKYYIYYEFYVSEYFEKNRKIHKYVICINEDEDSLYDQIHNIGITENGFQMEMNYSDKKSRKTDLDELFDKMFRFVKRRFAAQLKRERREIFDELLFHKIDQTLFIGDTVTFQEILDEYKEKTQDLVLKTI